VPRRKVHARRMRTIAREKTDLLYHVETNGHAVKAVMTMVRIDDAGTDGYAVEPTKRMITMMATLTTKIDVAIANADVVKDHRRVDRQADLPVGHKADRQMDLHVDTQAGLQADLQEDLTTRDQTAYIWSYPSTIAATKVLVILIRPQRIAVGLSWS
jgi:hypothetical protein